MHKASKIIIGILVAVVALAICLVVLAKVLITPERVRSTVVPLAEQALERKISLGEIRVSLFSGIELHDLAVSEARGEELFFASDLVRLRYQLLPLLALQVVIDEVRIDRPRIRVERYNDGRFNFSDLLGTPADQEAGPEAAGQGAISTPLNLLVTEVRIENGQLLFFDHLISGRAPYRHEITDFQAGATGITLDGTVPVTLSGRINDAPLKMNGTIHLKPFSANVDITLSSLGALEFKHYFEEVLPGDLNGLKLNLETSLKADPESLSAVGQLVADDLDLTLDALPGVPLENARVVIGYDLLFDLSGYVLGIKRLDIDYNGIVVKTVGQLDGLASLPRADLKVAIPGLDLRQAVKALPPGLLGPSLAVLDPAGTLQGEITLVGMLDQPLSLLKTASLTLVKLQATAGGQRPSLSGRLLLDGDRLHSEKLILGLGDDTADVELVASNLFSKPVVVRADLTSKRFQLDPLLQGSAASAGAASNGSATSEENIPAAGSELGPFDLPVRAEGEIRIAEARWQGVSINDFAAGYTLHDNVLNITRMDGQLAGGSFSNKARLDLGRKGLAYSADLNLNAIQANQLIDAVAPAATGSLFGQLDMTLTVEGSGTDWQVLSKNLTGNGELSVQEGKLVNPGLVRGLAGILQLASQDEFVFDTFVGNLRIKNGKVLLDGKINSAQIRLYPKGSIGLDQSLDLNVDTRLSPELSARLDSAGNITRYLKDDEGWSQIPLKLAGSLTAPRFGLDAKGLQKGATRAIQQEIEKQLFGSPESDADKNAPQTQEDPARRLLKGLFGQ